MPHAIPRAGPGPRAQPTVPSPAHQADRERQLVAIVRSARAGDPNAWAQLVQRFDRVLRRIARSYRIGPADVDDVLQATWLNLFEAIDQLREPAAIGGWLVTATRRNALRRIQMQVREQLTDDPQLGDRADDNEPERTVLARERGAALAAAVDRLPGRHRDLMNALLAEPALGYREVSERVAMPLGSIGPIRARALARLARDAQLRALGDCAVTALPRRAASPSSAVSLVPG
jgi:RNA polymerase sigma factor (sigma-70 family)